MSIDADVLPAAPLSDPSQLGGSIHIKGEIVSEDDMRIDGAFEGLLQLENSKLTIGPGAKVRADIIAREVVVYGTVKGNIHAKDRIEIKKDGSVIGDLTTSRIMIEDGAYFKGDIGIDKGETTTPSRKATFFQSAIRSAEK